MAASATTQDYMLRYKKHMQDNYAISENEWDLLKEHLQLVNLKKNEYFVQKGKVCRLLGFIAAGVIRWCMYRDDGQEITCFFSCENNFVGDPESFNSHQPSDKNAQALTECALICFSYEDLQNILKAYPRFIKVNALIDRDVMMDFLNQRDVFYNLDAAAKYQKFIEYYPHILQRVPLSYIASFLGIAQQSLSRLRKQIHDC